MSSVAELKGSLVLGLPVSITKYNRPSIIEVKGEIYIKIAQFYTISYLLTGFRYNTYRIYIIRKET